MAAVQHTMFVILLPLVLVVGQLLSGVECNTSRAHNHHHHLYRNGEGPDSCSRERFTKSEWTGSKEGTDGPGQSLMGTDYALHVIHKHQYPDDCSNVKYLLWIPTHHGIGSNIHCMGAALANALNTDRVLIVPNDEGHPFYDTEYCEPGGNFHDCYFESLTSCTHDDVMAASGVDVQKHNDIPEIALSDKSGSPLQVIKMTGIPPNNRLVPPPFNEFLAATSYRPEKHFYWWRAVSAAYIVRPNKRTLGAIEERKKAIYPAITVPQGATAVHVRHGDKGMESPLVADDIYVDMLNSLYSNYSEEWRLTRNVFLSTEDEATVEYFKGLQDWDATYTDVERFRDARSPMAHASKIGKSKELLNSLVSLDLALECDAFIMTLSSNWCRLIDELRATVRCKADRPFLDAQQDNEEANYDVNWRRALMD